MMWGDDFSDLETNQIEGKSDIDGENKEEEREVGKDHGSEVEDKESEAKGDSGLRRFERNKDQSRRKYLWKRNFDYMERASENSSLSLDEAMQSEEKHEYKKSFIDFWTILRSSIH